MSLFSGKYIFRKAVVHDIGRIMQIIDQAKEQMQREGSDQWNRNYPIEADIAGDISRSDGYVLQTSDGIIIAYGAAVFTGEPAYSGIRGKWLSDSRYVVLHRLAVADEVKGKGVAYVFIQEVESLAAGKGVRSFRIDTRNDNVRMLRVISRLGFTYCGEIYYLHGSRMAFEKFI